MRRHWLLDPAVAFLNHGSFGACPRAVLEAQTEWRRKLETSPVQFLALQLPGLLEQVREQIAPFVGANPADLAFVRNATEGVNTVLRSLSLQPGDELLTTNHTYAACANALRFVAERTGATVRVVEVPFPLASAGEVVECIVRGVTPRTRLALIDHVTSVTGLVFPITNIVRVLRERGIETLVDGAHAPGMVDLDVEAIGAAYYAGNFHKWLCAPKGAGMLWVRRDLQTRISPLTVSHGLAAPIEERFLKSFDWTGTADPTPWLCISDALRVMADLMPGGWPTIRKRNHELALQARDVLCRALAIPAPAPDSMLGSLVSVPLPACRPRDEPPGSSRVPSEREGTSSQRPEPPTDGLYAALVERGFETLVLPWPHWPERVLRVSVQLYNRIDEYERLASVLPALL
jgi:isopenicillin-N epimerase